MRRVRNLVAICMLGMVSSSLLADMAISPLRLDLNNQASAIDALSVLNRGTDQSILQVQASAKSWTQTHSQNVYSDQNNILLLPPIFGVPAGQTQIVRVALLQPNTTNAEQAYRIFIDEFNPQQVHMKNAEGTVGASLNILLDMSIPVFVAPDVPKKMLLNWSLGQASQQSLPVIVSNLGNTHVHFTEVTLTNGQGEVVATGAMPVYVLAGAKMIDLLAILKPLAKGETLTITAKTDDADYPSFTAQVKN